MTFHGSAYTKVKVALVTKLAARTNLQGVKVGYEAPVKAEDIQSLDGSYEAIWLDGAEGTLENVITGTPNLSFDETYTQDVVIQVLRLDLVGVGPSTQQLVEQRAEELLYEVLAEISAHHSWDKTSLDLNEFSYLILTPVTQSWEPDYLEGTTGGHTTQLRLGVEVRARRSYN